MSRVFVVGPRGGIAIDDGGRGEGLPLVLVHGATGSAEHWTATAALLRSRRRVVVPELPGHGLSDPPKDVDWSTEALAEALHLVAEELGLERFALAGHSLGGAIVAEYAASHPERVAGLAFVDAGPRVPSLGDLEEARHGFRPDAYERFTTEWFDAILSGARPATRELVMKGLRSMPRPNFMALVYGELGYDMAAAAARYPGPKLALCAEALGISSRWSPPVEVRTFPGVSHWLHLDAPDEVAAALERFLAA
jgi:pimeloyl-ACP methyl ester carboxylesterase